MSERLWVVPFFFSFMLSENRRQNAQINGTGQFGEGLLLLLPPGDFCDLGFCWMSLASTASDALFVLATCPVPSIWAFSGRKNDKLVKKQGTEGGGEKVRDGYKKGWAGMGENGQAWGNSGRARGRVLWALRSWCKRVGEYEERGEKQGGTE